MNLQHRLFDGWIKELHGIHDRPRQPIFRQRPTPLVPAPPRRRCQPRPATRPACGRSAEPIGPSSRRRVKDGRTKCWPVRHGLQLPRWPWLGWPDEVDEKAGTPVCLLKVVGEDASSASGSSTRRNIPSKRHATRVGESVCHFSSLHLPSLLLPNPSPTSRSQESAPDLTMTPPKVLMVRMIQARMRGVECARGARDDDASGGA